MPPQNLRWAILAPGQRGLAYRPGTAIFFSIPRLLFAFLKTFAGPPWHLTQRLGVWAWQSYPFLAFQALCLAYGPARATLAGPLWHLDTEAWGMGLIELPFFKFQDCCLPPQNLRWATLASGHAPSKPPLGHLAIWTQRLGVWAWQSYPFLETNTAACPFQNRRWATLPSGHRGFAYRPRLLLAFFKTLAGPPWYLDTEAWRMGLAELSFFSILTLCLLPSKPSLGHLAIWTQRLGVAACPLQNVCWATLAWGHSGLALGVAQLPFFSLPRLLLAPLKTSAGPPWPLDTKACPPQNLRWATLASGHKGLPASKPALGHLGLWTQRLGVSIHLRFIGRQQELFGANLRGCWTWKAFKTWTLDLHFESVPCKITAKPVVTYKLLQLQTMLKLRKQKMWLFLFIVMLHLTDRDKGVGGTRALAHSIIG